MNPEENNSIQKKGSTTVTIVLTVLFLISACVAVYYYKQYDRVVSDPNVVAKDELASLVKQISTLMVLPTGENPTFVTVTDTKALEGQQFFANAKVGDKVIVYSTARKAILYRPSEQKIIEVAPITSSPEQQQTATTPTSPNAEPTPTPSTKN